MFLAVDDPVILGGGAVVLVLAIFRSISSDIIWRGLIREIRTELQGCKDERTAQVKEHAEAKAAQAKAHAEERSNWKAEKATLVTRIAGLEGEVISLRRELHTDKWLGIDASQRPVVVLPYDQGKEEHGSTDTSGTSDPSS